MEIGRRIREHRAEHAMSQDDLAARVYVSRQTISSWENGKTYPDVQSLLLLSEIFGTTIDDLVKGDVEAMTEKIENASRMMSRLALVMVGFILLFVAAIIWLFVQMEIWGWDLPQLVPTALLALVLWGIGMAAAVWVDRIKRENDLVTYREISAFMEGRPVDREVPASVRARSGSRAVKLARIAALALAGGAVGAALGYLGFALVDVLLGS